MSDEMAQAREILDGLAVFGGTDPAGWDIERLGGLTNLVFRLAAKGDSYCLRLPGKGTEDYIDRKVEAVNARAAAAAGVSPEVFHCNAATGIMVTRFLEGAVTMSPAHFADRPGAPARAARAFRQRRPYRSARLRRRASSCASRARRWRAARA